MRNGLPPMIGIAETRRGVSASIATQNILKVWRALSITTVAMVLLKTCPKKLALHRLPVAV